MAIRVLHLVGSAVNEFYADLSRLYAQDCLDSTADADRYEFHVAFVSPDGRWRFPSDLTREAITSARVLSVADAVGHIAYLRIDVMVPQMFCLPGMTHYRALFDLLDIPYLGNPPEVMALAAHKARAKAVVAAAGVSVPAGQLLRSTDPVTLEPPAVVKPVDADNSLGVALVRDRAAYGPALAAAFTHGDEVLVETYVELGREVRCGVVVRDGELIGLSLEEYNVDPHQRPIRGHADKIRRDQHGDLNLVAKEATKAWIVDRGDPITERVWAAAEKCHTALGCRDYSLFDFRVDPAGEPWFLEAGLYCSFARQSVISVMAEASGIPLADLFHTALEQALHRRGRSAAVVAPQR